MSNPVEIIHPDPIKRIHPKPEVIDMEPEPAKRKGGRRRKTARKRDYRKSRILLEVESELMDQAAAIIERLTRMRSYSTLAKVALENYIRLYAKYGVDANWDIVIPDVPPPPMRKVQDHGRTATDKKPGRPRKYSKPPLATRVIAEA